MPASKGQALRVLRSLDSPSPLTPVALMTGGVPSHAKRARGHHTAAGTNGDTVPVLLYRSRFAFKTATLAMACAAISLERFSSTMAKMAEALAKRGELWRLEAGLVGEHLLNGGTGAAPPHHCRF